MRKIIRNIFVNNYKNIFYLLLKSKSNYFNIKSIELELKKSSILGKKNSKITTKIDQIILPNIMRNGKWDFFIIKFIKKNLNKKNLNKKNFCFIDVGANIGLISKQLLNNKLNINKFYCIEPEKENFELLKKNLNYKKFINLYNIALTNEKSCFNKLFLSTENLGDHSLIKDLRKKSQSVKCLNINYFFSKIINEINKFDLIYKSDTQGFDEQLILSLKKNFLDKIKILILEISNFNYLKKNRVTFLNLINNFEIIEDEQENRLNQKNILAKLDKKVPFNLLLSKN